MFSRQILDLIIALCPIEFFCSRGDWNSVFSRLSAKWFSAEISSSKSISHYGLCLKMQQGRIHSWKTKTNSRNDIYAASARWLYIRIRIYSNYTISRSLHIKLYFLFCEFMKNVGTVSLGCRSPTLNPRVFPYLSVRPIISKKATGWLYQETIYSSRCRPSFEGLSANSCWKIILFKVYKFKV